MNRKPQTPTNNSNSNSGQISIVSQFSGPIPPPETLAKYETVIHGAAERILKMAENEAEARISNDCKLVNNIVRSSFLGMFFAFASVLILAVLAYFALANGHPTVASAIVVVIASVAGIFVFFRGRKPRK